MSNATKILGTNIVKAMATGKRPVQQSKIIWSYLTLGKVALNHTKRKQKRQVFIPNIILCRLKKVSLTKSSGINQPPINRMALKVDISTIEQYSPRKKNTKIIEECSVKNPATNSDSASCRSNGVLAVSASIDIKKIMKTGNKGTMNQIDCWFSIIVVRLNEPVSNITIITAVLKINS